MGIKASILSSIVTTLGTITTANGYSLSIQSVTEVATPTEKLNAQERLAAVMVSFGAERKVRRVDGSPYANDVMTQAVVTFNLRASMDNATHTAFLDFLEDIEAVLTKDETRGSLDDPYYTVDQTWVSDIDYVEVEESNYERIQEAHIVVNVSYNYIPLMLSGTSGRIG